MGSIYSYLTFSGNCREAMVFYKKCLGGELHFQLFGDSPLAKNIPGKIKKYILHGVLKKDGIVLMGSDAVGENGLLKGNAVSIMIDCETEKEIKTLYKKLSQGGKHTQPLEATRWGAIFGGLTDRFGNHWLLHFNQTSIK